MFSKVVELMFLSIPKSLELVDGTTIHFEKQELAESFVFKNPNVSAECGCGESFTVE